ncbi:hypothetical protein [Marinobacterium rhizophilum]|uniref:hypothetical protein n=1 Tax=Marinobacterium rhizophilum TaxID=420402 RepID=UPI000362D47E|nr:hypothetical protein [Marinobacterium rhizophilum]
MLKVEGLNQFYGESHTLWDVALDVPKEKCTVLNMKGSRNGATDEPVVGLFAEGSMDRVRANPPGAVEVYLGE